MKNKYTLTILILLLAKASFAQHDGLGTWNILNLKYNVNQNWSVFGEGQVRSLKFYSNFHYYEYKGGINYKIDKNLKFTLGAGSYQTFNENGNFALPKNNDELRLWPQIIFFQSIGCIKIEQRYRSELRFTSNGFRNRFRYRLGLAYSFGKVKTDYKPYQISTSNELFFTNNEPYFERNRAIIAFNYKPSKASTLQVGYLHQFDYKINDEVGRDFLQIGLFFEIFRKKTVNNTTNTDLKDD